jgi:mono/diheme cytochrome c family protein
MPPWGGQLSDEDMEAIIAWFQSLWPDEIYDTWAQMDAETRKGPIEY